MNITKEGDDYIKSFTDQEALDILYKFDEVLATRWKLHISNSDQSLVRPDPLKFQTKTDLINACGQSGIFTLSELLEMSTMFKDEVLPDDYAELLEITFKKQLSKKPYTI